MNLLEGCMVDRFSTDFPNNQRPRFLSYYKLDWTAAPTGTRHRTGCRFGSEVSYLDLGTTGTILHGGDRRFLPGRSGASLKGEHTCLVMVNHFPLFAPNLFSGLPVAWD